MPVKVLYVHRSEKIGGGNRVLLGLFDKLDRRRFEPLSVLPRGGPMEAELQARNVPYTLLDVIGPGTTGGKLAQLAAAFAMIRLIRKHRVRLLHANTAASYRLPSLAARLTRVKRICHIQLTPEQATLERCLRVPPHVLIFCSQALLTQNNDLLRCLCPRTNCCVVVNSVDIDRLRPGPPPGALVGELRLTPGQPVVSLIGQICERKGHPHFLEMAGKLRAEFPQARFLVVGSDLQTGGAYQRQMEQYAQQLGVADVVSFLGFRTDVGDLIRASDVIVLPSRDEGLPLSLLEAAACAKPIVAYQTPGVDEVVLDGQNGFLTPHSADALASAVGRLLREPHTREQMGQAGREHMEKKFSLKAQVEEIQSIYDRLLGGN